jgi:hypothetical protein
MHETRDDFSNFHSDDDAFYNGYDDDDDDITDNEGHGDVLTRSRTLLSSGMKPLELHGLSWDNQAGTKSPTYLKNKRREYFQSPKESTPIFKRLVSKTNLKPQLKSFRRISSDLQKESEIFQNEVNHERLFLLNLKEEEKWLSSNFQNNNNSNNNNSNSTTVEQENMSIKKFDMIKKANEIWNRRKHADILDESPTIELEQHLTEGYEEEVEIRNVLVRKRSNDEYNSACKRRAVSTSPIRASFFRKANRNLIPSASTNLEKMSLD